MSRPVKYSTQKERLEACRQVQMLVREMKELSGWSADELADAMKLKLGISGGMLRQYLAGKKPASEQRLTALANEAVRLHCAGKVAAETLFWASCTGRSGTIFSAEREGEQEAARLEQALASLLALGYSECDLLYLVSTKLKSLIPPHEQADGGMVDPSILPSLRKTTVGQNPVWVTLQIKPWS